MLAGYTSKTLLLLVIALSGCNLAGEPEIIYVTATPPPAEAGPTAIPTLTPTPTLPPTPSLPPEVALQTANQALTNGYFEEAVGLYQQIVSSGLAPAEVNASALFGIGRSALREGLFQESVNALSQFISTYPNDSRFVQAHFLRGDAYMGVSQWQPAMNDFQFYLERRPGLVDSYVQERIGDAMVALGQTEGALTQYAAAAEAGRSLVPALALREKVAQVFAQAGQPQQALAQYEAILAVAQNAPYRAQIEFLVAQTLLESDATDDGLARLELIVSEYPTSPQAYDALQQLQQAGREQDDYVIGQISYYYGDYQNAIDAFNRYTTQRIQANIPAELHLLLGRAYREIGNPDAAQVAFQTVVAQYPTDPLFGQALLEQGRTRFLSGDIPGAIQRYQEIASQYNYLPEAAEALWRVGYLYGTNDNPAESQRTFELLAQNFPNSEQARSGLFLAASAANNAGDPVSAERLYAQLATTATGEDQAAAYLAVGRLAQTRGDQGIATQALQAAVAAAPDSYFGARATDILNGRDTFAQPTQFVFQFDDAAQIAEAENWIRERFGVEQTGDLWPLSTALQSDTRLIRANELWFVGAYDAAEIEFRDLISANEQNGLASYQLAVFLRGIEAYNPSILAAANVLRSAGVSTLDAPPYLARMRYPTYYLSVVEAVSTQYQIDPLLLFSLIRHESLFDTYATAAAGEKGLTQVIPSTAQYIADELNWPDYQHSDLFRPYAGIEFGAFFLAENLRRFDGNAQAALAGYNAGPGRAIQWLELSGGDPDQFMTAITIESTRIYVQRIYGFYSIYRALYGVT